MVGKPGTAPGLPVPKTGGLLLSHIPMKYLNESFFGVSGRTRTFDLPLRRRTLYPAELQAH